MKSCTRQNPFDPVFEDLPDKLPIFPLDGIVLLPRGDLPLNVYEEKYMNMIDDVFKTNRMIGIVQPLEHLVSGQNLDVDTKDFSKDNLPIQDQEPLYRVGCAGRITQFAELEEGRYLVTLRGVCRFSMRDCEQLDTLKQEVQKYSDTRYRIVHPDWSGYRDDLKRSDCPPIDRKNLCSLLQKYFTIHEITLDWGLLHNIDDDEMLMTALSMICPFSSIEKQALLESPCITSRLSLLLSLLEMSAYYTAQPSQIKRH